jgi:YgiT-type zinc finger domain-containing protein
VGSPLVQQEKNTMTTTVNHLRCAVCGGEQHATTITHQEQRGRAIFLFHNVPARVCSTCGALWIDADTLAELDRIIYR